MNSPGSTAQRRARKTRDRVNRRRVVYRLVDVRDGQHCRVCECLLVKGAHHHHVKARSLGGKDTTENLVLVCVECHRAIHDKRIIVTGNADSQLQIERRT